MTGAQKALSRQERQAEAAARQKAEKATRDAQLRASHAAAASMTAIGNQTQHVAAVHPAPASPTASAAVVEPSLPGVKPCVARLLKLKPKLQIVAKEIVGEAAVADTSAAANSSIAPPSYRIMDARSAVLTFVDGARSQQVLLSLPPILLSTSKTLRTLLENAARPEATAISTVGGKQQAADVYNAARQERERARKEDMQRQHAAKQSAQRAAQFTEQAKQQARKAQVAGALSREDSMQHGERNAKIVSGVERGKCAKM